jgi:cardiolipin synthase
VAAGGPPDWNVGQLGHIEHRKVVVVDGRIGWVGGAGIEDHFEDGRFHDLFLRVTGPVVSQLQLVFIASFLWLGGSIDPDDLEALVPGDADEGSSVPAQVVHNAPGLRPLTAAIARMLDGAAETLDVVSPFVIDRGTIRRIESAARRSVRVRVFSAANANRGCTPAQRFHYGALLDAGVRIFEYPTMLHAKALVRDGEEILAGTCNLDACSLRRFFEIGLLVHSAALAAQFEERFAAPAELVSTPGRALVGRRERLRARACAAISPLL